MTLILQIAIGVALAPLIWVLFIALVRGTALAAEFVRFFWVEVIAMSLGVALFLTQFF